MLKKVFMTYLVTKLFIWRVLKTVKCTPYRIFSRPYLDSPKTRRKVTNSTLKSSLIFRILLTLEQTNKQKSVKSSLGSRSTQQTKHCSGASWSHFDSLTNKHYKIIHWLQDDPAHSQKHCRIISWI